MPMIIFQFVRCLPAYLSAAILHVQGLGESIRHFYLLFQHHTTRDLAIKTRQFLQAEQDAYSQLLLLGPGVAVAMPDQRFRRTLYQVIPLEEYFPLFMGLQHLPDTVSYILRD